MPKTSRSEQMDFKGLEIIADEFTGSFNGSIENAAITALTNLTGTVGTANNAMTALAATTAAATEADTATLPTKASVDAIITACNNNFADLQAKVNSIIAALKS